MNPKKEVKQSIENELKRLCTCAGCLSIATEDHEPECRAYKFLVDLFNRGVKK